ncbi:MAG: DUF3306 domain-containing protein [Rhodospirillales bacterium]|nr:DUF3306 domain-containing protein [Rhodospirillales bacterium]
MSDDGGRGDDGFLVRWSRRKRAERLPRRAEPGRGGAAPVELARAAPPDQPLPTAADAQASLPATREQELEEEKARRDLPPVNTLDKDSDYTRFLKKNVPEALKRQALKRLWTSDPQFHVVDPFTEYGGDYTVAVPIGASLYKPGLGYLTEEELEQQKNLRAPDAVAEGEGEAAEEGKAAEEVADAGAPEGDDAAPSAGETTTAATSPPQRAPAAGERASGKAGDRGGDGDAQPDSGRGPAAGAEPGDR